MSGIIDGPYACVAVFSMTRTCDLGQDSASVAHIASNDGREYFIRRLL